MTRRFTGALIVCAVLGAAPAAAQSPATPPPASPTPAPAPAAKAPRAQIGISAGLESVQNVGLLLGGQFAYAVNRRVDITADAAWLQNVVSRRQETLANSIAAALAASQGKVATVTLTAPAGYGGGNIRVRFPRAGSAVQPYLTAGFGFARVTLKPVFLLGSNDVTSSLTSYGVSLGADLTGTVTKPAFTGGAGILVDFKRRYIVDAGARLTSIQTDGQKTNVLRGELTFGVRF